MLEPVAQEPVVGALALVCLDLAVAAAPRTALNYPDDLDAHAVSTMEEDPPHALQPSTLPSALDARNS